MDIFHHIQHFLRLWPTDVRACTITMHLSCVTQYIPAAQQAIRFPPFLRAENCNVTYRYHIAGLGVRIQSSVDHDSFLVASLGIR
jgi:hypothetical protein